MKRIDKHVHFVGIGGIGMSALALLLKQQGHRVSGSDMTDSHLLDSLRNAGITITLGHSAEAVGDANLLVYSSAIKADNPERHFAEEMGIQEIRRAELLGEIAVGYTHTFAIAGTHGKTTTTGMCGQILVNAGQDPSILVGGILPNLGSNLRIGNRTNIVLEADEYDRSFLALSPDRILITTLEADHLDIYRDMQDIEATFQEFISKLDTSGILVIAGDDPVLDKLAATSNLQAVRYGQSVDNEYQATELRLDTFRSLFTVRRDGVSLGTIQLQMPGEHNVLNALGACALMDKSGIEFAAIKAGLEDFQGVERRFQKRGERNGVIFIDDYAHHPSEIAATLAAARSGWPQARIVAVFQPHLYSRTRDFAEDFALALEKADTAIVTDIYPAREAPIAGVSSELIADHSSSIILKSDLDEVEQFLQAHLRENDLLITLGAGDIWKLHNRLLREEG